MEGKQTSASPPSVRVAAERLAQALPREALEVFQEAAWSSAGGGDEWSRASGDPVGFLREKGVAVDLADSGVQLYLAGKAPTTIHGPGGPKFGSSKEHKNRPICALWAVETMDVETDIPPGPVDGPWGHSHWVLSVHHCLVEIVLT